MALNNVPLAGQTLGVTRVPINQNFAVIDAAFLVDHIDYNLAGQGQHNKITFPIQAIAPAPVAGAGELYTATSALTAQPELFFAHQAGSTAPAAARIVEFTSAGWGSPGWCRLPSGILMKWGNVNPVVAGLSTFTYPVAPTIPVFTVIYTVLITTSYINLADGDGVVRLNDFALLDFRVYGSQRTAVVPRIVSYDYLSIGI